MPERDGYIPGVPCWVDTLQPDPEGVLPFYEGLFGWEFENGMPEGSDAPYFIARINGGEAAAVGHTPPGAPPMAMWNTYVAVQSADASAAKGRDAGGTVLMEPFDVGDAGRMAVVADPEGAVLCLWEAKANPGATVVNEHGALNFNTLHTRDLDSAQQFYGALFGWQILTLPSGTMWMLPGYGDHLEERNPGLREQMAGMDAPDGFIDVVAAAAPLQSTEVPPHWAVTFGVDDADAVASAATELGGEVVAGPVDAPWTRTTTIRDPQGAEFVAAQFVYENKDLTA